MKYKIIDWDGEKHYVAFVGKNKDEVINYLLLATGLELEVTG